MATITVICNKIDSNFIILKKYYKLIYVLKDNEFVLL